MKWIVWYRKSVNRWCKWMKDCSTRKEARMWATFAQHSHHFVKVKKKGKRP